MAYADLVITTPTITSNQGAQQLVPITTKDSTGANIDITAWFSFNLRVFTPGGQGGASDFLNLAPTPSGGSGTAKFPLTAANATAVPPGAWNFIITGKVLTGDDPQVVARGTFISSVGA